MMDHCICNWAAPPPSDRMAGTCFMALLMVMAICCQKCTWPLEGAGSALALWL